MKKKLNYMLLFVLFGFLLLSQTVQITSHINVHQIDESTISSAGYESNVNAAHITAPTTLPVQNEYKADEVLPAIKPIVYQMAPTTYLFNFFPNAVESAGFLDVRKYQSNYLP